MFNLPRLACAVILVLLGLSQAVPLSVHDGGAPDIIITAGNTLNASAPAPTGRLPDIPTNSAIGSAQTLQLSLVNNIASTNVHAYVTGLDTGGRLVILQPDGTWFYPSADPSNPTPQLVTTNVAIPVTSTTYIGLPDYISAGRIWFADGTLEFFTIQGPTGPSLIEPSVQDANDPSAQTNWGFVELTTDAASGVFADITYVDFVGLPLGITLDSLDGSKQSALGLPASAVNDVCNALRAQAAADGQPWDRLCVYTPTGNLVRVLSPFDYIASINGTAFSNYFTNYVNDVWSHFTTATLTIDGQTTCTVQNAQLTCADDNRPYAQPSARDIFGCNSGPFFINGDNDNEVHHAVVPILCAAFNRGTLLISNGDDQPDGGTQYHLTNPHNYYSAIVHQHEIDGKGYAFAYDDVVPAGGANWAGVVRSGSPTMLTITVG